MNTQHTILLYFPYESIPRHHQPREIERYIRLLGQIDKEVEVYSPIDFGLEDIDVEENADTLAGNAELKVRAYAGKVDMPILANDTGFYVEGMGLVEAPKRITLNKINKKVPTKEEVFRAMVDFWKDIATKNGGEVDAAWIEAFALLYPDGTLKTADSRREVVLTNQEFATPHIQLPLRALYYSKTTNKPAILHTKEEENTELEPIREALKNVLGI